MAYIVKEIFKTLQGEGYWSGRTAVFIRFAGCNLWTGREEDRADAACPFCDTDFADGMRMTAGEIAERAVELWGPDKRHRFAVVTGGEPLLQLDAPLVIALRAAGFSIQVETNGTRPVDRSLGRLDWVTCSPKAGAPVVLPWCDELKLVYPQQGLAPEDAVTLFSSGCGKQFLQPMDGPDREANTRAAVEHCLAHPEWRLSLQTHKIVGIP